jgi:LysM repeat protein
MTDRGYDNLGPRIDMGLDAGEEPLSDLRRQAATSPATGGKKSGGALLLGILALAASLVAVGLGLFAITSRPAPASLPDPGPGVVPGATAERTAKLEKDVGQLMLRMVSLEKELHALKGRSGSVNQLTELTAKVAALQERIEALTVESRIASMKPATKKQPQAASPPPVRAPASAAPSKPQRKKQIYKARPGDTLWTLSQRYKVSMKDLMRWNNLKASSIVKVGQELIVYK